MRCSDVRFKKPPLAPHDSMGSVHFLSAEIHIPRQVVTESLVLRREQVIVEYQEVRVLADRDGALGGLDAELLRAVDARRQEEIQR